MTSDLKEKILELAAIAKACPENLQLRCFELLLEDFLASRSGSPQHIVKPREPAADSVNEDENGPSGTKAPPSEAPSQEDFADRDLHVKVRKFLKDQSLSIDHINQIFYKEGEVAKPLYEDLKTTKMAESQIRVALLQALKNAVSSGEFEFDGEAVRTEVQLRKCYDPANFTAHFKNNKALFDVFEKYDKQSPKIKLSSEGRVALAAVIKELQ
jgi:hypothetical protein